MSTNNLSATPIPIFTSAVITQTSRWRNTNSTLRVVKDVPIVIDQCFASILIENPLLYAFQAQEGRCLPESESDLDILEELGLGALSVHTRLHFGAATLLALTKIWVDRGLTVKDMVWRIESVITFSDVELQIRNFESICAHLSRDGIFGFTHIIADVKRLAVQVAYDIRCTLRAEL